MNPGTLVKFVAGAQDDFWLRVKQAQCGTFVGVRLDPSTVLVVLWTIDPYDAIKAAYADESPGFDHVEYYTHHENWYLCSNGSGIYAIRHRMIEPAA